jgi:glycosyltransferase involved in cell wall biosynthesis
MRIVQVIDSLEVGGAERMAVNYANSLSNSIAFSGLVATRKEGDLKLQLENKVHYLFLNKTKTLDWMAAIRLKKYCKAHQIDFIQPHSSSYFIAFIVKLIYPKIKIIWHDHNGLSEFLGSQKWIPLKIASFFFKGIIVVNYQLKAWAIRELNCKQVVYLPNFTFQEQNIHLEGPLHGLGGKRILCLANLRDQKNHFLLVKVAEKLKVSHPDWSFHLVGKDFEDDYSMTIKTLVQRHKIEKTVFFYGTRNDAAAIIQESDIAILTSKSEGLPVALLEYGLYKKSVVVTEVGEMPLIIQNGKNGCLVPSNDEKLFYEALVSLIEDQTKRNDFGIALYQTILEHHSENSVISKYINWIKTDLKCY